MSDTNLDPVLPAEDVAQQEDSTFAEILSNFEQQHAEVKNGETVDGTIVSVNADNVLVDVGRKTEGALPVAKWRETQTVEPERGATITVSVGPLNDEGYYSLSTIKVDRPRDWSALETAFSEKRNIAGVVAEQVKGGFRVDIGVRAFMPASRSGVRDADEMAKLVGQEIQCRITKLDTTKEDVVVDRRAVLEEEQAGRRAQRLAELQEGAIVAGRVRSLVEFGAFVDLGGVDGLLHVADMSYSRVGKAADLINIGDELTVKVLKIDPGSKKISLGLKQLQEDPWTVALRTFHQGERVTGTVSRLTDFGAFVELLPGVDGLIHVSELSWDKKVRKAGDLLKIGEQVEAVILQVNPTERRIALGYKQILGDPWDAAAEKFPIGSTVEGPVTNVLQFGGFVQLTDGIEGMIHIADITNEKRLEHAKEKLSKGQTVKAIVLEIDRERKRIRLGMKQLEPTSVDHYIAEHQPGETVSGRVVEVHGDRAKIELGEGVLANCKLRKTEEKASQAEERKSADVSSLSAMLSAKWKQGGGGSGQQASDGPRPGQVRSFRISNLDPAKRSIELEMAS